MACINWTEELIEEAIKLLQSGEYKTVSEVAKNLSVRCSPSALRHAFERFSRKSPSYYLYVTDAEPDLDKTHVYEDKVIYKDGEYIIDCNGRTYSLTTEDAEYLVFLYSSKVGEGLTGEETASQLALTEGLYIPENVVRFFLRDQGVSKNNTFCLKHQEGMNPLDIEHEMVYKGRVFREKFARDYKVDLAQAELKYLRKKFNGLTSLLTQLEDTLEIPVEEDFPAAPTDVKSDKVRIIPIADFHAGVKIDPSSVNFWNDYNKEVLKMRISKICSIIEEADYEDVTRIHVAFLGDLFEALLGNMRAGQYLTMDAFGVEQYLLVRDSMCQILKSVRRVQVRNNIPTVTCIGQGGNHDRLLQEKSYNSEDIVNFMLMDRVAAEFKTCDNFHIGAGGVVHGINFATGMSLLSRHGHKSGLKSNGEVDSFINLWKPKDQYFTPNRTLVVKGHLHNFNMKTGPNWRVITVPSIIGDTEFGTQKLNKGAPPEFIMIDSDTNGEKIVGPFSLNIK